MLARILGAIAVLGVLTTWQDVWAQAGPASQQLQNHVPTLVSSHEARYVGSLPVDRRIPLSIVLPLRNQDQLRDLLTRLYDPASPDYHKFLSVEEFTAQFGPTEDDYREVTQYASASGLTVKGVAANRLIVSVDGTVDQINRAFNVQLGEYLHPTEERTFYSPDREPSLPVRARISSIDGLSNLYLPHAMSTIPYAGQPMAAANGSGPSGSYLGSDMRAAYYGGSVLTGLNQRVALVEFGGYLKSDVDLNFSGAGQTYNVPLNNILVGGASNTVFQQDGEQVLDIVQAIGMAPGLAGIDVYIGDPTSAASSALVLNQIATDNVARQIGCSWGWIRMSIPAQEAILQEMAAQGQTFFAASGDDGAFQYSISPFFYPGESQFVTAVGGTHLTTNGPAGTWSAETAWNSNGHGSGGGISPDSIPIPSWQTGLANSSNGGSTTLRNVPDVAMEADYDNYMCNLGSCFTTGAGTSFAAPRWAGFMALVNQQAVEAGNAPLGGIGFINSALSQIGTSGSKFATDIHDLQSGNNNTANQTVWFSAVNGYDLVTGWGSPTGQALIDDLAGKAVPGFWISSSSGTIKVVEGSNATANVSIVYAGGFSDSVNLAVTTTLPSGVTASFNPSSTTKSSVLTFTASASAAQGTYQVTITGTSGTVTASTTVTLVVLGPSFTLSSSQLSMTINPGASVATTITVNDLYGFTGNVNLSVIGLPTGLTASFATNPTSSTSILTFSASNSAVLWKGFVTVVGTSGSLTSSVQIYINLVAPTFTLSPPTSATIGQGTNNLFTIYISAQNGFTGNVMLSASGLPDGVTAFFLPNPTSANGSMTLVASGSTAVGTYPVTITGTSGSITNTAQMLLTVKTPSFTLSGGGVSVAQGSSGSTSISISSQNGFNGAVTLSATGLPAGVTATFATNPTTNYSAINFIASSTAAPGNYTVTINGTAGTASASTAVLLTIGAPTFTISAPTVTLSQSGSSSYYIFVNSQFGFNGNVTLSLSGLPAGVTASLATNPTTYSSQVTLTASSSAAIGNYSITVTGTSGSITKTAALPLSIVAPSIQIYGPNSVQLGIGTTSSNQYVTVYGGNGYTGNVTFSLTGLPSGITATFATNPINLTGYSNSSQLNFTATNTVTPGNYTVNLTATSGSFTASTSIILVVGTPGFTLSSTSSLTISQSASVGAYVNVNPTSGFNGSVTFSVSGLPSGVSAAFSSNPTTSSSNLTFSATNTAALGIYPITVTGTSGSSSATTTLSLTVVAPSFTISLNPAVTAIQGTSLQSYVNIIGSNGFAGAVNLSASGLPSGVTAGFGTNPATYSSSLTLVVTNTAALGTSTVTITGTYGTITTSATIALTIAAQSFTFTPVSGINISPGGTEKSSIGIVDLNGFNGVVTFSIAGLPSGITASWNPPSSATSSTLTLTASSSALPGSATATITGTSGAISATAPLLVTIRPPGTPSATVLTITSNGSPVTSSPTGMPINLSAFVSAGGSPVKSGQVNFCDSTASYCGDIHLLGTAQLNSKGSSSINLTPLPGNHSYKAVFVGTAAVAASTSSPGSLQVTGGYPTSSSITSSGTIGNYTLNALVTGIAPQPPSGNISFLDTSNSNASIATGNLVPGSPIFASSQMGLPVTGFTASALATGDFNGDGISDVALLVSYYNAVIIELGNPDGTFTVANLSPQTSPNPLAITAGDFNNDGKIDIAVVAQNTVSVLLGNGDGSFNPASSNSSLTNYPISVASGDFNADGNLDLVIGNNSNNTLAVLLGNGDGTFTTTTSSPSVGFGIRSMVAADFNGDGNLDIVATTFASNVVILLGSGNGNFTSLSNTLSFGSSPTTFAVGDFNGDGKPDLAVGVYYSSSIPILLGNGDGTFNATSVPTTANYSNLPMAMDINQDGIADLVMLSQNSTNGMVLVGRGDGTFTSAGTLNLPGSLISTAVGTVTNKGYPAIFGTLNNVPQPLAIRPYFVQTSTASATGISMGATGSHNVEASYPGDSNYAASQSQTITINGTKSDSIVTWAAPIAISYGTPLSSTQLNATANVPGTFFYAPAAGVILGAGTRTLSVTFTPTDSSFTTVTSTVTLVVNKATPTITWAAPLPIVHGTPLGATQLNATSTIPGTFAYLPAAGTVPGVGSLTLSVTFTPTDQANYTTVTASVVLTVLPTNSAITWATPAAITYGTALSASQLNATSTLPGTFVYSPAAGTVLSAGSHTLSVTFTPADTSYSATTAAVTLVVIQATPTLSWAAPSAISYGTALSAIQLSASSNAAGSFSYTPTLGAVLAAGTQSLLVVFTPTDSTNFVPTAKTVQLTVNKVTPVVSLTASPAFQFQADPVTFNAVVPAVAAGGPPSGSVTFYDGVSALGTSSLSNGSASFTTSSLGLGAHSITAAYAGDSNYVAASTSSAITETIGTMTIASTGTGGSTVTSSPGGQAVFTLSFNPPNGQTFPQAIQLSVSGLPSGATATFSPSSIPAGSGATNVTLTIAIPASASVQPLDDLFRRESFPIALALAFLPFAAGYRKTGDKLRRANRALLTVVVAIALTYTLFLGILGCGGGGGSSSGTGGGTTSPRTYPLTITASSGTYSQTTSLTLVVK